MVVVGSDLCLGGRDFDKRLGFELRREGFAGELDTIVKEAGRMHEEEESLGFGDIDFDDDDEM